MKSLYRVYRPTTFAEVSGQPHVVSSLTNAVAKKTVHHAYLFQGPRGTGKTTTARLLAKALNCTKPKKGEPCGTCVICKSFEKGGFLDIIEIDAASNRGIDDVRALREAVLATPVQGTHKVYIIDEVHMLTKEAFAALLKTLEEPSPHAVFILATTELHKVPETIISRCQLFRFRRAKEGEMADRLEHILKAEKVSVEKDVLQFIISRSDGCYRDAESLLGQFLSLPKKIKTLDEMMEHMGMPSPNVISQFIAALGANDSAAAISGAQAAYDAGHDPDLFIEEAIRYARDEAVRKTSAGKPTGNLPHIIRSLVQAKQDLAYVPQPLIAIQLAIFAATTNSSAPVTQPQVKTSPAPTHPTGPQPRKEVKSAPIPGKTPSNNGATVSIDQVTAVWPQLITATKEKNPAASTFLRAMQVENVSGSTITIRAQYGLHRNFFEKPEHKKLLQNELEKLVGTRLDVKISLAEQKAVAVAAAAETNTIVRDVKEIFG